MASLLRGSAVSSMPSRRSRRPTAMQRAPPGARCRRPRAPCPGRQERPAGAAHRDDEHLAGDRQLADRPPGEEGRHLDLDDVDGRRARGSC